MNATHEGQDAADVLERAADEMERRGKTEGDYTDARGGVCVYGALCCALGRAPNDDNSADIPKYAYKPIMEFIRTDDEQAIANWSDDNDAPTVIAGLRAIAATLRAQQAAPVAAPVYAEMES